MKSTMIAIAIAMVIISIVCGMGIAEQHKDKSEKIPVGRYVDIETGETLMITFVADDGTVYVIDGDAEELEKSWNELKNN